MLGFSTQHPTVSCGTERPHLPPLGPAGVTNPPLGWPIVTKPRFRPSVSTAKSRYFNNLRLPYQTHTLLWAANWPHPGSPLDDKPEEAECLDVLLDWAPDEAVRKAILVDNPAVLYGFD